MSTASTNGGGGGGGGSSSSSSAKTNTNTTNEDGTSSTSRPPSFHLTATTTATNIRVGIRIRPLLAKEKRETCSCIAHDKTNIDFKTQIIPFDHVFGTDVSQEQLYSETVAPLLTSYLEGFNVTIIAYGQTGSGKTYTMGTLPSSTSTPTANNHSYEGIIPRFVSDLFANLSKAEPCSHLPSWKVSVSFLEIYGEDVFDLHTPPSTTASSSSSSSGGGHLSPNTSSHGILSTSSSATNQFGAIQVPGSQRPSLPVREDQTGRVFVQGLREIAVTTPEAALEVLFNGARNRITGATNMNASSSRSHAVYIVRLTQIQTSSSSRRSIDGTSCNNSTSSSFDTIPASTTSSGKEIPEPPQDGSKGFKHQTTSALTFVDLAGSERLKRTGAEGVRLKEGIQINSGLFNLGQVINALADDQRLKSGTKLGHVPYRNSKLTHILKDALGGNSQTLFLACVSPAESSASETLSTLNYARQARNIRTHAKVNKIQLDNEAKLRHLQEEVERLQQDQGRLAELLETLAERDREIAILEDRIGGKDALVAALQAEVMEQGQQFASQQEGAAERLSRLETQLAETERLLAEQQERTAAAVAASTSASAAGASSILETSASGSHESTTTSACPSSSSSSNGTGSKRAFPSSTSYDDQQTVADPDEDRENEHDIEPKPSENIRLHAGNPYHPGYSEDAHRDGKKRRVGLMRYACFLGGSK